MHEDKEIENIFFEECKDLLIGLENDLNNLCLSPPPIDCIDSAFRAAHSIKGGAAAFKFTELVKFAHAFENTLDHIRTHPDLAHHSQETLLYACDTLADLVENAQNRTPIELNRVKSIMLDLSELCTDSPPNLSDDRFSKESQNHDEETLAFEPIMEPLDLDNELCAATSTAEKSYEMKFVPQASLFAKGHSVTRLLKNTSNLADMNLTCDTQKLPDFDDINPSESYLSWEGTIKTSNAISDILDVFDFAVDDCELEFQDTSHPSSSIDVTSETNTPDLTSNNEADIVDIFNNVTPKKQSNHSSPSIHQNNKSLSTRIDLDKLENVFNLIGELYLKQSQLSELIGDPNFKNDAHLISMTNDVQLITKKVQDHIVDLRAQPVQPLFQRMARIVRETAKIANKPVKLLADDQFTELDVALVEGLVEPLTHLIRNAIDHGIEASDIRLQKGKTEEGILTLTATQELGKIIIKISDDGAGIDIDKIKQKATKKGLIKNNTTLSEQEILNFIFAPGFSTNDNVTQLSGRGVGLDVVKKLIKNLGGNISIKSSLDHGTTFILSMPLTLAILEGITVKVGDHILILPLNSVLETVIYEEDNLRSLSSVQDHYYYEGKLIPLIDIKAKLNLCSNETLSEEKIVVYVQDHESHKFGFLVDKIIDQRNVIIKAVDRRVSTQNYIYAATILENGHIAYILDIDAIVNEHSEPFMSEYTNVS